MRKGKDGTARGGARPGSGVEPKKRPLPPTAFTSETARLTAQKRRLDANDLPPYIIKAFDLRLQGSSVEAIADQVKRRPRSVREWFERFSDAYQARRLLHLAAGRSALDHLAEPAVKAFSDGLDPNQEIHNRLRAAEKVAGYLWGVPGTSDSKETPPSIAITYIDVYAPGHEPQASEEGPIIEGNQLIIPRRSGG